MNRIPRGLHANRPKVVSHGYVSNDVTNFVSGNLDRLRELTNEGSGEMKPNGEVTEPNYVFLIYF